MFGLDTVVVAIIGLAALSAGALGYGVLYSRIEVERKAETRVKRVKAAETDRSKVITQDDLEGRLEPLAHLFSKAKDIEPRFVGVSTRSVE